MLETITIFSWLPSMFFALDDWLIVAGYAGVVAVAEVSRLATREPSL